MIALNINNTKINERHDMHAAARECHIAVKIIHRARFRVSLPAYVHKYLHQLSQLHH